MQIDPKPRCGGSVASFTVMLLLIIGAEFAVGRPDVRESPFARELQPPLLQPDVTFNPAQGGVGGGVGPKAIDSYGNPIDALRPIDTPDGRKVVSAQGVQFEIPTYASGITEIRRPADDLLPPHIDNPSEETKSTTASSLDAGSNPFDSATIPAWLRDFDYPDVGPGVPFDPDNFGPSAASSSTRSPTNPPPRPPTVPSAPSAFPSKVTLPLPVSSSSSSSISSSEEPPLVLVPRSEQSDDTSSSGSSFGSRSSFGSASGPVPTTNSLTPFAARFEPQASSPNSAGGEPFPPSKVEYTKSDEGKVISTPVASNQRKTETAAPVSNNGKYTGGFGAPAGLLKPLPSSSTSSASNSGSNGRENTDIYVAGNAHEFSEIVKANKAKPTVNPGRYNGGFGAPTGVLSPQSQSPSPSQSQSQSHSEPRPFQSVQQHQQSEQGDRPSFAGPRRTDSRFGGPPGILVPFDNVQRTGGQ
ncbi:mucin-5AC isoform X3 [Drosophila ficusphila]|uniref:mucin-5AC isoform X3 n=1 Tax=Drosophila ficusphila TaxID=30025 RepID=UPI0007E6D339|nr:mucin-5AC isoform X3 [Drosophila ficusphila]